MFKLTIKKQDGSTYWVEHFNTQENLDRWLNEERSRLYWKQEYTTEIQDLTPPPPTQEEIDREQSRKNEEQTLKARLRVLANRDDLTEALSREAMLKYLKLKLLNGEF